MSNIEDLLNTFLPHDEKKAWYRAPNIPPKKLNNAFSRYASLEEDENILALGDGTVFGSAKTGVLITDKQLQCNTSEGTFKLPWNEVEVATRISGFPDYALEIVSKTGTYRISTTCFDANLDALVHFLNLVNSDTKLVDEVSLASEVPAQDKASSPPVEVTVPDKEEVAEEEPPHEEEPAVAEVKEEPVEEFVEEAIEEESPEAVAEEKQDEAVEVVAEPTEVEPEILPITQSHYSNTFKFIEICLPNTNDLDQELARCLESEEEQILVKGYCQYVGYNRRSVDGLFIITNKQWKVFSLENGPKLLFVETSKRLLGRVPFPFFDDIVGFFIFSIPRKIYDICKGGREKQYLKALETTNESLLSGEHGLRFIRAITHEQISQVCSEVEIGNVISEGWTIFSNRFGLSFVAEKLSKTLKTPEGLMFYPEENPKHFRDLLLEIRGTLRKYGWDYFPGKDDGKLHIQKISQEQKAVA